MIYFVRAPSDKVVWQGSVARRRGEVAVVVAPQSEMVLAMAMAMATASASVSTLVTHADICLSPPFL